MPTLYASLVGIDAYPLNPLSGCVKDVLSIDLLLRQQMNQQSNIVYEPAYFLAPKPSGEAAIKDYASAQHLQEFKYELPTFKNVSTKAFMHLKNAKNGDTCVFYYSGHGSQTDAPEVFWHTKPDRQNETIVCVDSRDAANAESRDIIDKELAWLLWDVVNGKEVHCLVIMDCCHSGNNTREFLQVGDTDIRFRYYPSDKNKIPFEDYLGYGQGFYTLNNGNAGIQIARYVHLAAARDSEKAQESSKGGLFTRKLMEALQTGGTTKSYRELVQSVGITVHNQALQQNPVAFARDNADLDLRFLGNGIRPYQPSFEVRYDFNLNQWIMYGGAMHNIIPSSGMVATTVKITGTNTMATITEVKAITSVLDEQAMAALNKEDGLYQAVISSMANPLIKISPAPVLLQQSAYLQTLKTAYNDAVHLYYTIDFDNPLTDADFLIQLTDDAAFVLTKPGSQLPLFKRQKEAGHFLLDVDAVSKWMSVAKLNNANTTFSASDFIFRLEKLEGKNITPGNSDVWETFGGQVSEINPDTEQVFNYQGNMQPAFRLSITLKSNTIQSCYIGALYMSSMYGIDHSLIQSDTGRLQNNDVPLYLSWNFNEKTHKTILLRLDKAYRENNINEIAEFLKIFVATDPINLERYRQENLQPDVVRSMGFDEISEDERSAEQQPDWAVFTFPFRIVGAAKEKKLEGGKPVDFSSFVIEAPPHFTATVYAATGNDIQQKLQTATRSGDIEGQQLSQMIAPPESIWGNTLSSEILFTKGLAQATENGIRVLELFAENSEAGLQLNMGEEMLIRPKVNVRSVDDNGLQEITIPFGYDEESQMYFPLGFTDDAGIIHVQQLPPPTPGKLRGGEILTRSIGSSIKLFFKKIFQRKKVNTLTLYRLAPGKDWEKITDDPGKMKAVFEEEKEAVIVLMIHGIIGDMKHITESMMQVADFSVAVRFVLAYDYENLATPIIETATVLKDMLATAGFDAGNPQKVCIVAHSMGGLVARWLVEQEGADKYISKVIFAGTPNAGSEVAELPVSVSNLLTHAMNVTGPIKYALTSLSFLLRKLELNPGETLVEMDPGSDFLKQLIHSTPPAGIPYYIIGGNTALLKTAYNGDDFFLKKIGEAIANDIVYPGFTLALFNHKPNDIAVSVESMQTIPGFNPQHFYEVASDHLSYFTEKVCRDRLLALLALTDNQS